MLISGIYSGDSSWPIHLNVTERSVVAALDRRLYPSPYGPLPTFEVRTRLFTCACGITMAISASVKFRAYCDACRQARNKLRLLRRRMDRRWR